MMMQTNNEQGIRLDRAAKILLLNILQQGYIKEEQKSELQKLLQIPCVRLCYADSADIVSELKELEKRHSDEMAHDLTADKHSIIEAAKVDLDAKE